MKVTRVTIDSNEGLFDKNTFSVIKNITSYKNNKFCIRLVGTFQIVKEKGYFYNYYIYTNEIDLLVNNTNIDNCQVIDYFPVINGIRSPKLVYNPHIKIFPYSEKLSAYIQELINNNSKLTSQIIDLKAEIAGLQYTISNSKVNKEISKL